MLVGTGDLGLVLHGDPTRLVLGLAHEEGFVPLNPRPPAPALAASLAAVRAATISGDLAEAERLIAAAAADSGYDGRLIWTDPYLPVAEISWQCEVVGRVRDHRRTSEFATGVVTLTWTDDQGTQRVRASPDRAGGAIEVQIDSDSDRVASVMVSQGGVTGAGAVDYSLRVDCRISVSGSEVELSNSPRPNTDGTPLVESGWQSTALIDVAGASWQVASDSGDRASATVSLRAGSPVLIRLRAGVRSRAAIAPRLDHAELVRRSTFSLGVDPAVVALSTEELIRQARSREPAAEQALTQLAYAAGRAHIIAATGKVPPNLVGVWQGTWAPAWSGDYTLNGNVQLGGVAGLVSTGTPELLLSLFRLVDRFTDNYRANAQLLFGVGGMHLPSRMSTHGHANHFSTGWPHQFWIGCGGWVLRMGYDYFSATGDRDFLDGWLWPFATEVLRFYDEVLTPVADTRHVVPAYSPENTPGNSLSALSVDATSEIATVRDAYQVGIRLARLIGQDKVARHWAAQREALPPYRVASDGSFAGWLPSQVEENHAHRHQTQLHPFVYEGDERIEADELGRAGVELIKKRLAWREEDPQHRMEMAFGLVQLGLAAARLGQAELAADALGWLVREHWQPNGMTTHDAGAIFNADASGGIPALVAAMLLLTQPGTIRVLPALPAAWGHGRITGLVGADGVMVDELRWTQDHLVATLRRRPGSGASRTDDQLRVVGPDWVDVWDRDDSRPVIGRVWEGTVGDDPIVLRGRRAVDQR